MKRFAGETLFLFLYLVLAAVLLSLGQTGLKWAEIYALNHFQPFFFFLGRTMVYGLLGILIALPALFEQWKQPGAWKIRGPIFWGLFVPAALTQLYLVLLYGLGLHLFFPMNLLGEPFAYAIPIGAGAMLVLSWTKRQ